MTAPEPASVDEVLSRYRQPIIDIMRSTLSLPLDHGRLMRQHMGYEDEQGNSAAGPGGKMLRPALCLLACEAVDGDVARAFPAAAAIELLHNFTLIHDDIEDASDTRHGRETLWRRHGVPLAINAGDGMFVRAQLTMLGLEQIGVPADRALEAARVLNEAAVLLCEGQHADISFESRDRVSLSEYEAMIAGKTASLIGASAQIGAIAGGADDATCRALGEFGRMLGMAFQIQDDVLGVWGESARTGKPVADDIRSKKKSFPVVWAFDHARGETGSRLDHLYAADMTESAVEEVLSILDELGAQQASGDAAGLWREDALRVLDRLSLVPERQRELEELANFIVTREA
ncbi:MAG: polyprenyl synthetase family protein [Chloroflexi bacterium]|nr:polyprenyl synthetase family protein [Chloroflexota bacterium]